MIRVVDFGVSYEMNQSGHIRVVWLLDTESPGNRR